LDRLEINKRIAEIEGELALLSPVTADGKLRQIEGDRQETHRKWDQLWAEKRGLEMEGSRPGRRMTRAREDGRDRRGPPNRRGARGRDDRN
jgi:hypothetical protein